LESEAKAETVFKIQIFGIGSSNIIRYLIGYL